MYAKFNGSCLKQDKIIFNHGKTANIYIVYDLNSNLNNFDPTLENCSSMSLKIVRLISVNSVGFDSKGTFSHFDIGQNVIVSGADMTLSAHADKKTRNILLLGEGITQGLDDIRFIGI